jgi:hypothetical protein
MKKSTIILTLIVLILTACTGEEAPAENPDVLMTSAVGTMVASFFETQTAVYTPPLPTSTPVLAQTPTPTPTIIYPTVIFGPTLTPTFRYTSTPGTPTPTGTLPTATVNGASLAVGCNNLAFVRDVNIPSGTVLAKDQVFTKTWKVENTGTCAWTPQYILVSAGGDTLGGETMRISKTVTVGDWSELSVELQAPENPGKYTSYWRLSSGQSMFGATLAVSIVVKSPTATSVPPTATRTPTTAPAATSTYTPTTTPTPIPTETPTPTPTPP